MESEDTGSGKTPHFFNIYIARAFSFKRAIIVPRNAFLNEGLTEMTPLESAGCLSTCESV